MATMGDVEDQLYRLIEVAERQQEAAQTSVHALAAERAAFAQERETWFKGVPALKDDVRQTIAQNLRDAIATLTTRATGAEESLRTVAGWASRRLLLWGVAAIAGLMLVPSMMLWWQTSTIEALQTERVQLLASVAELRAHRDAWVKAGMVAEIRQCGASKRPCVKIDESAGAFGDRGEYRLIAAH